jgi:hypothetical protein
MKMMPSLALRARVMQVAAWGCGCAAILAAGFGLQGLIGGETGATLSGAVLAVLLGWGAQVAHVSHTALRQHLDHDT